MLSYVNACASLPVMCLPSLCVIADLFVTVDDVIFLDDLVGPVGIDIAIKVMFRNYGMLSCRLFPPAGRN
jgi:hypothetical protein